MTTIVLSVLSGVGTVCSIIFGYMAFTRNKSKDDAKSGAQNGIVLTELGYVKSGIDDIKRKQEKQETQYIEVIARLVGVEASARQAHKRLDAIDERMKKV